MLPKPKYREMDIVNPNKPHVVQSYDQEERDASAAGTYKIEETVPVGCNFSHTETWPEIGMLRAHCDSSMQITQINCSRWGSSDEDLSGLQLTNSRGNTSEILGSTRHTWVTNDLLDRPIDRVQFIRKSNDEYMRGMKIHYRDGSSQVINSASGEDAGTFQFNQGDVLIGMNMKCTSPSDKRPRQIGFILLRDGMIFETEMYGNSISKLSQVWPSIESL